MPDRGISELGKFMTDYWQFMKRFYTPDPDAGSPYWSNFVLEADELIRKYEGNDFVKKLVFAFMDYTEGKAHD